MYAAEAMMLAFAMSVDAFFTGLSYGGNGIIVKKRTALLISFICSLILGISMSVSLFIKSLFSETICDWFCFILLFGLGSVRLLDSGIKAIIRRCSKKEMNMKFSFCNIRFVLSLYADPEFADIDASKTLSGTEAILLAFALSLDSIAVGIGAVMGNSRILLVILFSFLFDFFAILSGICLGNRMIQKNCNGLSWLGGVVLIALSICKILI